MSIKVSIRNVAFGKLNGFIMFRVSLKHHRLFAKKWHYLSLITPRVQHTVTCPESKAAVGGAAEDAGGGVAVSTLVRGEPPSVRMAFLPEEWFTFLQSKTGVSGPYVLMFVLANYLISKEIYVMEHEYYSGLSIFVMVAFAYVKIGPALASWLDKEVDEVTRVWEKSRQDEVDYHNEVINMNEDAIMRAKAQDILMCAKKENIAMQLEACFRERAMTAYSTVKGRLDYHVKVRRAQNRIQQKWMIEWILSSVRNSITPEFQKQAFAAAIANLDAIASSTNK